MTNAKKRTINPSKLRSNIINATNYLNPLAPEANHLIQGILSL